MRGVELIGKQLLVQDEIEAAEPVDVVWHMHTRRDDRAGGRRQARGAVAGRQAADGVRRRGVRRAVRDRRRRPAARGRTRPADAREGAAELAEADRARAGKNEEVAADGSARAGRGKTAPNAASSC